MDKPIERVLCFNFFLYFALKQAIMSLLNQNNKKGKDGKKKKGTELPKATPGGAVKPQTRQGNSAANRSRGAQRGS